MLFQRNLHDITMNAVFLDFATVGSAELDIAPLLDVVPRLTVHEQTSAKDVPARIQGAEFVFANKVCFGRELIMAAPDLRFIGLVATGVDNVDLDAAAERGVAVCNIRAYCTQSVVEHVFAVLLSLSHNIPRYQSSVRAGNWQKAANFCLLEYPIRELSAMTLGIVGHGELGQGVARIARQFGMQVLLSARPGQASAPVDRVEFSAFLRRCDVVSLHCPLTDSTRGLFGTAEFELMKPGAILINTARGGLVDSAALVAALQSGTIAAAAIDVLTQEPPVDGDPLLDYAGDNLVITPHIAWATVEARQNAINELAANVIAFLNGEDRYRVV
jgi:glycerate dehydrogenase